MPSALLWKTVVEREGSPHEGVRPRRPVEYRAPSWSWAAVEGSVSYESQRLVNIGDERVEEGVKSFDYGFLEVVGGDIQLAGSDRFGAISTASLQMRGCILAMRFRYEKHGIGGYPRDDGMRVLIGEHGCAAGALYPDIISEVRDLEWVYCLSIKGESFYSKTHLPSGLYEKSSYTEEETLGEDAMVMGLALMKDTSKPDTYTRVGLIRWVKKSSFLGIMPSLFTFL